jgi:Bacteriophage baseplate protein W
VTAAAPWRLGGGRRLAATDYLGHLDDLVRVVLLTGPGERLHRPGFGAGLGQSALFEPLSDALGATVTARARGSLTDALGDRIQVLDVTVSIDGSTLSALVSYRPLPAGGNRTVTVTLPVSAL